MKEAVWLKALLRPVPPQSDPKLTHTVKFTGDPWPRIEHVQVDPTHNGGIAWMAELDMSCPRCGTQPKIDRRAGTVTRHHPVVCFFVRMLRVARGGS